MTQTDNYTRGKEMLSRFDDRLDERARTLLDEFVENNEHGLALEELVGILVHGDEPISRDDYEFLRDLGRSWETPRDPIPWSELELKVE